MKITVYNDTDRDWEMHASSDKGANGEQRIPRQSMVNFEVSEPHTRVVFIKVWDDTVTVRVGPDLRSRLGERLPERVPHPVLPLRRPPPSSAPPEATRNHRLHRPNEKLGGKQ